MNASLLLAQCLGSTMHICFVLSQIPGCSQSWCYSYTHNSKGPLDQLSKVKITHQEYWAQNYTANYLRLQWEQSKSMFSLSDGDFPFSDDLYVQYWHWNTRQTTLFSCFLVFLLVAVCWDLLATVEHPVVTSFTQLLNLYIRIALSCFGPVSIAAVLQTLRSL